MIDAENGLRVHWMIVNIVGNDWDNSGATVAEYDAPTPPKVKSLRREARLQPAV